VASNVSVGYQDLQQAAGQLSSGREELVEALRRLESAINGLTGSGFKTHMASGRFRQHYQQWTQSTTQLVASLDEIARAVRDAQSQHEQVDRTLAAAAGTTGASAAGAAGAARAAARSGGGGSPAPLGDRPPRGPRNFHAKREAQWGSDPAKRRDVRTHGDAPSRTVGPSHKPNDPRNGVGGEPKPTNSPSDHRTGARIDNRSNQSENVTARVASKDYGFKVRQDPPVPAHHPSVRAGRVSTDRNPDFEIEGKFFDNKIFHPKKSLENIYSRTTEAINGRQADGVILDLTGNRVDLDKLVDRFRLDAENGFPLAGEVWVRRGENMFPIWP
jgi:WXG100 family type VII secretion target